jgi:hypothetical protein
MCRPKKIDIKICIQTWKLILLAFYIVVNFDFQGLYNDIALQVLNCPSALCTYNTNPLKQLKEVAEPFASTYNIFIRAMVQGMQ